MASYKSTSGKSNEETENSQGLGGLNGTSQGSWDGSTTEDGRKRNSGTILVTDRSEKETHEDCSSDTDNIGSPNLLLGKIECFLDFREERSDGEPNEESNKETPPGIVERSHVRTLKAAELDLGGSVILIGIDGNKVLFVRLVFFLIRRRWVRCGM